MPHQCVRCKASYEDGSSTILTGCACGSKFFFFYKDEDIRKKISELSQAELTEIKEDVEEIIGDFSRDKPVVLDFESVRVTEPGKFEIDLVNLFKRKPIVYQLKEGVYVVDLASTFQVLSKDRKIKKGEKKGKNRKKK